MDVKLYTALVQLSATPDGVSLADPELRAVVLASDFRAVLKERDALQGKLKVAVAALENIDCSANGPSAVSGHPKYNPWGIANYCIEQAGEALAQIEGK